MKLMNKKSKPESALKKKEPEYGFSTQKELAMLKAAYKSGKLKFDSKEIAKSILNDCKQGFMND